MSQYTVDTIRDLVEGTLPWTQLHSMMSGYKDTDRFEKYIEVLSERVPWDDPIILPLTDRLYVVEQDESAVVKCECGHVFGDCRENWKHHARILIRNTEESIGEVFGPFGCDPDVMELRELICPGCGWLLEVETAVPGYPLTFDFQPDLVAFYEQWLDREVPDWMRAYGQSEARGSVV